jgi:dsDNA-specific endonuclease/ATPase MutS2
MDCPYCPLQHSGRSNALNIASRLGLNSSIIDAARQRLAVGVAAANAAIEELEAVQEELQASDMVLFAVKANVQETKVGDKGLSCMQVLMLLALWSQN